MTLPLFHLQVAQHLWHGMFQMRKHGNCRQDCILWGRVNIQPFFLLSPVISTWDVKLFWQFRWKEEAWRWTSKKCVIKILTCTAYACILCRKTIYSNYGTSYSILLFTSSGCPQRVPLWTLITYTVQVIKLIIISTKYCTLQVIQF